MKTYWESHMNAVFKALGLILNSASQAWAQMPKTSKLQARTMVIKLKVNSINYRWQHSHQIKMKKKWSKIWRSFVVLPVSH